MVRCGSTGTDRDFAESVRQGEQRTVVLEQHEGPERHLHGELAVLGTLHDLRVVQPAVRVQIRRVELPQSATEVPALQGAPHLNWDFTQAGWHQIF